MQLKSIKLAGFKSFVDPTTVPLPSQLVAVVGPNGCGKSNIIDAVRWVMGESSAKQLRGDSMADVIFNGSATRKPLGQASIELLFDNSAGKLGGAYAQYSEIVIRREVTRAGQSNYYLNGTHCRRRDITDIFLGTGLGPRSYAIIEQGTISRLVEAKPDELRVYLEEAAGISKYKERRRETELRMQHTRENLSRLEDIRGELNKQLEHLQKQANTAEKYQNLKDQEQLLKAQLLTLRWITAGNQLEIQEQLISQNELQLEEINAQLAQLTAQRENLHVEHDESYQQVEEVQQRYYQLNTELARLEQTLQYQRERQQQLQNERSQAEIAYREAEEQLSIEQENAEELSRQFFALEPQVTVATNAAEIARSKLSQAENDMQMWQMHWDEFNQQAAASAQRAQVEQNNIQHLEHRLQTTQQRITRIEAEQQQQQTNEIPAALLQLQEIETDLLQQIQLQQDNLTNTQNKIHIQREENKQNTEKLDFMRSELQSLRGRHASLLALQEEALGKTSSAVIGWLQQQQLESKPRLAESIHVDAGWERAIETVLSDYLEAVCVDSLDQVTTALQELTHGTLTVVDAKAIKSANNNAISATLLLTKIESEIPLYGLLTGVYVADTLNNAIVLLSQLQNHESVITPEGIWVGHGWLRVARDADEKGGVIQRERELTALQNTISDLAQKTDNLSALIDSGQIQLHDLESERDTLQNVFNQLTAKLADVRAQARIQQAQLQQQQQRASHLAEEYAELCKQFQSDQNELAIVRNTWQEVLSLMEKDAEKRDELMHSRDIYRNALDTARSEARTLQDSAHQLDMQLHILHTQRTASEQLQIRLQQQLSLTQERLNYLQEQIQLAQAPQADLDQQLTELLDRRQNVENDLKIVRQNFEEIEQKSRECDKQKQLCEQRALLVRNDLEQYRLTRQSAEVRRTTVQEQLTEAGFVAAEVQQNLPQGANDQEWEEQLIKTQQRIERLGPINLAAISEYATQAERKNYLDSQHEDLITALSTLETAIRKIDQETRDRFKEVYEQVNGHFQTLFPRVFGGGQAYLELLGEDLLDTGVAVIARPPGKRNSTIHLLSGGEKALTAIALVFSIFQLNPAPFCLLDEVDAPLDDANIGRFCELVKEMSKTIQFVYISHNKLAMEMADHLTGVTMHEPGVSRLVAVDMHEALAMAE